VNYIERAKIDAMLRILRDLETLGFYGIAVDEPHRYVEARLDEALRTSFAPKAALKHVTASRPEYLPTIETVRASLAQGRAPSAL
jgi:hypothetical protein